MFFVIQGNKVDLCFLDPGFVAFVAVVKYHDQKQLMEEKLCFGLCFLGDRVHPGWDSIAWHGGWSRVVAGHVSSPQRKQRKRKGSGMELTEPPSPKQGCTF